jgi:ribosomal protein L11 methyltransferase
MQWVLHSLPDFLNIYYRRDGFWHEATPSYANMANGPLNLLAATLNGYSDAADYQGRQEKYDLVCANILGHLLIAFRFNIVSWVAPGGTLVLSGILDRDFDKVCAAFAEAGMEEIERFKDKDWTSGIFRFA